MESHLGQQPTTLALKASLLWEMYPERVGQMKYGLEMSHHAKVQVPQNTYVLVVC